MYLSMYILSDKQRDAAVRKHVTFFFSPACDREETRKASGMIDPLVNAPAGTRAENSVRWMLTTAALPFDNSNENVPGWMYIALQEVTLYLR